MAVIDLYAGVGYALELLARSEYHGTRRLGDYFRAEILPALWRGQSRFHVTKECVPRAMVTWAWLSKEVEREIHETGRALLHDEWQCGDRLFINDWIAPYSNIRALTHDIGNNVFPDDVATSLRRNPDGSVRRVCRWTGSRRRKANAEAAK